MNKAAIKKFAVESRQRLIKSVIERLEELGITDKEVLELIEQDGVYTVKSSKLDETGKRNRQTILSKIKEKGYEPFIEEVAYTWFNRIIAIRYMEVNDYLPFRTRVLSSEVQGKVDSDIITEIADHIEELELNRDEVIYLQEQNKQEELFKYVFIKVCNYLGQFLPQMFEQIEDYTELLLPSVMISNGSVIKDMIELVPEEDWMNQVEIIGWLYQYYISEKKDQVFADLKKNKKITKENIPAATQLFTPEWIVKYMVENSLGRLWLEGHPDEELKSKWKYYLDEAEQEEVIDIELAKIKKESEIRTPEDLTIIDPAMGSGHILVYAFDVLYQIYQSVGYPEKEIPRLILEKNIYGLDIDDRAGQLAYFALMMKARSYNRRFFRDINENSLYINILSIQESNGITKEDISYLAQGDRSLETDLNYLIDLFLDAKEYGSLIKSERINFNIIKNRLREIENDTIRIDDIKRTNIIKKMPSIIKQGEIMSNRYHILCTNPPYMNSKGMSAKLRLYLENHYMKSKSDLSATFMELDKLYILKNGLVAMINQHAWMFLSSFDELRSQIISTKNIINLLHLGTRAFSDISGEVVQSAAFVLRKSKISGYKGIYIDLKSFLKSEEKRNAILNAIDYQVDYKYISDIERYASIPNHPVAYWISDKMIDIFKNALFYQYSISDGKNVTGNNEKFLRNVWETTNLNIGKNKKWLPYAKGGSFRKWFGNINYLIDWSDSARDYYRKNKVGRIIPEYLWYQSGITWTLITSGLPSFRILPEEATFDSNGLTIFLKDSNYINYYMALFNSKVFINVQNILNPTLALLIKDIRSMPVIINQLYKDDIDKLVEENIQLCKDDWDRFEISLDFMKHPIIEFKSNNIENSFQYWSDATEKQFYKLKSNEQKLNEIFIDIYELNDELTAEVNDQDITIRKADRDREAKSFISYAVGCMMGRYSLDEEGLIFAGGEFDSNKYQTFKADEDGILLISDTEYFEDDLLNRFVEFVKVVYGEETLEENLNFIADTECFKRKATESSRDCLRRYFLKGFMEDHLKVYQKRPIYWMFDSGKQNGFKALIYLHRYNEDTVAKVRTDYLHPLQRKYEAELERLDQLINFESISASEKGKAKKRQEQIHKQLDECTQYDLLLAHVAHQHISLDLDDGVKVNYQKFQNIELTTDGSSKAKKGDLLYKVKM